MLQIQPYVSLFLTYVILPDLRSMQTLSLGYVINGNPLRQLLLGDHTERDIIKVDISIPRLVRFVSQLPSAYMVLIMLYVSKHYNVFRKI